jgi:hypothetical protein
VDAILDNKDIINRLEIGMEYQYLQTTIQELRDQTDSKKILGLVVDRSGYAQPHLRRGRGHHLPHLEGDG